MRHSQLNHAGDHGLDRVDRLANQQLLRFRKLARGEHLQRALERVAQIGQRRDLDRSRSAGEGVHGSEESIAYDAVLAQRLVFFLDYLDMCARFAAENGE